MLEELPGPGTFNISNNIDKGAKQKTM